MNLQDLFIRAVELHRTGEVREAEALYRRVLAGAPQFPKTYQNLGILLVDQRRLLEAEEVLQTGVLRAPSDGARLALAHLLLSQGRYAEGWEHYGGRMGFGDRAAPVSYPEWQGESLSGKSLLIWPEQGYGDQIQMARFVPTLRAGGAEVTIMSPPALTRLFQQLDARVVAAEGEVRLPRHDFWTNPGSLPRWLGVTLETLPAKPYLTALSRPGYSGVGVVGQGNPTHGNDGHRSLDAESAERLRRLGISLAPSHTSARDFQDTAEIVAALDLVISVDTSVAHLAGAMGKPVWILLPYVKTDWRWMRDRADSPWYPSARLFRQPGPGRWREVLDEVEVELAKQARN